MVLDNRCQIDSRWVIRAPIQILCAGKPMRADLLDVLDGNGWN